MPESKAVVLAALRALQAAHLVSDRDELNGAYYALTGQTPPPTRKAHP